MYLTHPRTIDDERRSGSIWVAAFCSATRSLGPGLRAVLWVQGCPFHCAGCVAPDWIPFDSQKAVRISTEKLVKQLLQNPQITGLTFSGGEPMLQASGLVEVARKAKQEKDLDIICFTGFRYEQLLKLDAATGVFDLLQELDVLIDGSYVQSKNDNRGLRGSSNQRVIHLSDRLKAFDLENQPRTVEVSIDHGSMMMVGIPPSGFLEVVDQISIPGNEKNHERT